jgi:protein-disulfide isomerase
VGKTAAILLCASILLSGCQGDSLKALADGQKQILERLDNLEKKLAKLPAGRQKPPRNRPTIDYNKVHQIPVGQSPTRGAGEATAVLVEFSDFQCPFSQQVKPDIDALILAYPNDLQHVYKHFPLGFHKRAEPAARACLAAGLQGKYWKMQELVYANPKKLEDSDLKAYASQLGLNAEQFEKDYQSDLLKKQVQAEMATARKAGVRGTPTLFLNGKRVKDRSLETMKKQIEMLRDQKQQG